MRFGSETRWEVYEDVLGVLEVWGVLDEGDGDGLVEGVRVMCLDLVC